MIKRDNYISKYTYNILDNIPSWMKMHNEYSNGFQLFNSFGIELERTSEQFEENFNDLHLRKADPIQLNELYFIDKRDHVNIDTIYASGGINDIPIKVVDNEYDFYNNKPTRIHSIQDHILSGIASGSISGLMNINYLYNLESGVYYMITELPTIHPSSLMMLDKDFNEIDNISLASGRVDYDTTGRYEILDPDDSGVLMERYPLYRLSETIDPEGHIISYKYIDHYEPQPSSGYENKWFYDDDGNMTYHFTRLNNPFGSGIYNLSSGITEYIPLEDTIRVYDILNLDSSGEPVEIPSSGKNIYEYISPSGDFSYVGYDMYVPDVYEQYAGSTGTVKFTTSWFHGRSSGYLDDDVPPHSGTFTYIFGSGDLNNDIWFYNAMSKYMVEYDYSKFSKLYDVTTLNRYNHNVDMISYTIPLVGYADYDGDIIPWELSHTNNNAIRVSPDYVRPGAKFDISMTLSETNTKTWTNPSGTAFSVNLYNNNLGYTQEIFDKNYLDKI